MPSPNPADRFEYTGGWAPTTLSNPVGPTDPTLIVTDATGAPTGAVGLFTVVVDRGLVSEEKILCATQAAGTIAVAASGRGYDGTVGQSHVAGATVELCWTAIAADADNAHNNAASGIHGVNGNVVGDTDHQVLTNKTLDGSENTFSNIPSSAIVSGSVSSILGRCRHSYGSASVISVTGAPASTVHVFDTTAATVSFIGPTSGMVWVTVTALVTNSSTGSTAGATPLFVTHNTTTVVSTIPAGGFGGPQGMGLSGSGGQSFTYQDLVTGLSAGTAYQWDLAMVVQAVVTITLLDVAISVVAA